jgi:alanyl-tRNA synthetase
MTSSEFRQSFLDFFKSKQHTIVPSASLMPTAPNLLFTNAGMNPFVPYFLGDQSAPWRRVADTQKCIRAGGKHNDLEDVGFDTYHHTFFEMLGNWSFGDYFKKESLEWGWELLTKVWGIPPKRLFATVYAPDKSKGDPAEFDSEAHAIWTGIFKAAGLDPAVHILNGNRKDNFWMMGETGPCGPCSEIHFNLLESDNESEGRGRVNAGDARCIEIWNHVFIQFNANADGTYSPLAAKHVDTGMGFDRVAGIHASTRGFKDFKRAPSNYDADHFQSLLRTVADLSGRKYAGTVPTKRDGLSDQEATDVAFRVLADHARCVSCAIADGILPGNEGRNYVIRRILRRGILYGKKLGLETGFFEKLVKPVVESLGSVFTEIRDQEDLIRRVIRSEEESFGRTLNSGLDFFNARAVSKTEATALLRDRLITRARLFQTERSLTRGQKLSDERIQDLIDKSPKDHENVFRIIGRNKNLTDQENSWFCRDIARHITIHFETTPGDVPGDLAFKLYDTFGFPLDMTQLLAAERGLSVDVAGFEAEMEKQRERGRAAQKKEVIVGATEGEASDARPTEFIGYAVDTLQASSATLLETVRTKKDVFLVFDRTPFYAEMGGQAGDSGHALIAGKSFEISDTVKDKAGRHLHKVAVATELESGSKGQELAAGAKATLSVDVPRRRAISRHHSATHLLHWALRKVLGTHVRQAGTHKTPDRLRFDFSHFEAVTHVQIQEVERLVNERVIDNASVASYETEFDKKPEDTLAFFGEKYGRIVRVVDIGGYSRELCGGTHVATTGEIGVIKIVAEMAIAAGTRRIEAVAGQAAFDYVTGEESALRLVSARLNAGNQDLAEKLESVLTHQKELEKRLKAFEQKAAAGLAEELASKATVRDGLKFVCAVVSTESPESLRALGAQVLGKIGEGVVQLGAAFGEKASVVAFCSPAAIKGGHAAGRIVQELSVKLGGKGGGKPDFAMGGGRETARLSEVIEGR